MDTNLRPSLADIFYIYKSIQLHYKQYKEDTMGSKRLYIQRQYIQTIQRYHGEQRTMTTPWSIHRKNHTTLKFKNN